MSDLPRIIVDSRDQTPLRFSFPTTTGGLQTGDYTLEGLEEDIAIERKTVADLAGSLSSGRERFSREIHRLRGFRFARLLIIGLRLKSHSTGTAHELTLRLSWRAWPASKRKEFQLHGLSRRAPPNRLRPGSGTTGGASYKRLGNRPLRLRLQS